MRNPSYPAFILFHEFPNCFAYAWNITSHVENTNIFDKVSANNLIGYFRIRVCESPEKEILAQVFGLRPFTHIYINRTLASLAKFKLNQEVILELVSTTICTSVQILPLSVNDYEIIERSSSYVEEVFLQQIRILQLGMEFPIWISPSVCAIFRVENISPQRSQPSLLVPSTELHILTPNNWRNLPSNTKNALGNKIKMNDIFPRIGTTGNYSCSPSSFLGGTFRVLPNSLVDGSALSTISNHPCIIYILGNECSHYITYGIMLVENMLSPTVEEFAHVIAVPMRTVLNGYMSQSRNIVGEMRPNICFIPNKEYLAYSTILLTTVTERQVIVVKNVNVFLLDTEMGSLPISDIKRDVVNALKDMSTFYPLLLSANGLSLYINLGVRSVLVHLIPGDKAGSNEYIRQGICCFVAEAGCKFSFKIEPLNDIPTIPSTPEPVNYGFLSQSFRAELGLYSDLVKELCEWAEFCWSNTGFGHALLLGSEGSGKTAIAACVARKLAFEHYALTVRIDCSYWKGKLSESIEKIIGAELKKLSMCKPSLLILDDFDFIKVREEEEQRNVNAEKVFHMLWRVLSVSTIPVLITAKQLKSLPKPISTSVGKRLFAIKKNIPPLDQTDRLHVLNGLLEPDYDLFTIAAKATENFSIAGMQHLATRIRVEANIRAPSSHFLKCDVEIGLSYSRFADNIVINPKRASELSLEDVGGMEEEKRKMLEILIWPLKYPEVFQSYGICQGRGVFLHGPSGCGKTLLANAIAAHSKFNSILVKGPELLSKYIGSSEENVRNVFERARACTPCIIIFDELDSLAPQRGSDSTGVIDRVVNQMLTEMDGVEGLQGVFVIGCSSRIDLIDSALLRPGRFDHILECRIPNEQDRSKILEIVLRYINHDPEVSTADWAARTDGWTGADLKALITNAQFNAVQNLTQNSLSNLSYDEAIITNDNIEAVFEDSRPRRSIDMKQEFRFGERVTLA